ncbi:TonB-dependent siderophore receptor [Haematobacter genomosp. 1]|uniref:TonB-dependent siderophore receptor n=1 Tax=Haematobacter genomosp. 1 TaxID=366618 RepID=A0A212AEH7_9RHOB|nr:TonB-dependent siderophore receptor [Haematobacter genomosp. 1]OWJ79703.1 TonB-dependent siderophore receptor [Haematobacter genomosp. 1]
MRKISPRGRLLLTAFSIAAALPPLVHAQDAPTVMDEVVISSDGTRGYSARTSTAGTKTSTPLAETPASISVVTQGQMEDQAVSSVAEALRYTPGVASEYRGTSNISDESYVRGFGYVPRYLEGLILSGSGQQIDPWLLQSVAVVKGPASLLYGQSNPGGLIDMELKKADGSEGTRAGLTFGTRKQAGARLDISRKVSDTLSWRMLGLAEKADTQEEGLETRRLTFAPSLQWAPTDRTTVTAYALYQREPDAGYRNFREARGTLRPTRYGYIPGDFLVGDPDFEGSERTAVGFGWSVEHEISDQLTFRQKARYSTGHWDQRTLVWGSLGQDDRTISRTVTEARSETRQAAIDNQLEYRLNALGGEHVLLGGVDFQYTRVNDRSSYGASANPIDWRDPVYGNVVITGDPRGQSEGISRVRQTGVYLQDQATWGRLHMQAGLRYDWAKNESTDLLADSTEEFDSKALTGRLGFLYEMESGFSPYASYSTSFEPVTQVAGTGQAPFDPTEGEQVELGVKWANRADTLTVTASVYDLRQTNVLKYDDATALYEQVGEIRSRGFELEGRGQVTEAFSLIAGYSYNDSKVSKSTIREEIGTHNDRVPRHQASLWGKYAFGSGWDAGLGVRYVGESWARGNAFTVPGVTLVDMAIGYDFGAYDPRYRGLRAQLNITNLTDEFYASSCASAYACWVGAERHATLSLDYTW